jgi:hypothetical protein
MSLLRDPSAVHAKLHRTQEPPKQFSRVSVPSIPGLLGKRVTSFLRGSVSWAGDAFSTYWDGLSKEERERRIRLDARKQIAYLKMRTVSDPMHVHGRATKNGGSGFDRILCCRHGPTTNGGDLPANWTSSKATMHGKEPLNRMNIIRISSWNGSSSCKRPELAATLAACSTSSAQRSVAIWGA